MSMSSPLSRALLWGGCALAACAAAAADKAPFRLIYNNDTTNLESCAAPFHAKGAKFTPEVLYATIAEAAQAGADAYAFAPGLTYVPLWQSQVYPPKEHFEWFRKTFPDARQTGFGDYLLAGGDMVADYVKDCRELGIAPFISLRLNDYHMVEYLDTPAGGTPPSTSELSVDRFRREHPQWRLKRIEDSPYQRINPARDYNVMNFAVPQVRARFLAFVQEICAYDIDGLEIDFLRHFRLFNLDETTATQRADIVTQFIKQARAILNASAKPGQHRWLAVRIPAYEATYDALGINIPALAAAGVDMFNISANYYTLQQGADYAKLRAQAPDKAFYWEMTHVTEVGPDPHRGHHDSSNYRRTTDEQFYTTADLAYAAGYDGVSLFNFQYYRDYEANSEGKGPFGEPPFHVLKTLKDPAALAREPQHYFMAPVWQTPYGNRPALPAKLAGPDKPVTLVFRLAPPAGGWTRDAVFRIQTDAPLPPEAAISAALNGRPLAPTENIAEPYPTPFPQMLGDQDTLRAWVVPQSLLKAGDATFTLTSATPCAPKIIFADMAAR